LLSLALGLAATKLFKFPPWVTPAVCFNNTTSLPLLLIQSLGATGVLDRLIVGDEKASDAIERAKSYFLVCAIVGNCLTFAIGPRLLDAEDAPDHPRDDQPDLGYHQANGRHENVENDNTNEQTSLLPNSVRRNIDEIEDREYHWGKRHWDKLSPRTQNLLDFVYAFFNSALIGAVLGAIIGLAPPLHRAFFSSSEEGGFLNAWLTSSLSNIGQLFVSLQVVVVGVSLGAALRKMKRGEASGAIPWIPSLFVLVVRFILWPVISIALIWAIASKTRLLGDDPILWFAMMLMPTGPTAMKLVAMADCNDADEDEKMSISKFLVV
jgi:auxin efflux carrier family protein